MENEGRGGLDGIISSKYWCHGGCMELYGRDYWLEGYWGIIGVGQGAV